MSCYAVSDASIDVLVRAGLRYRLINRASADLVGQALRAENIASVTFRYPDVVGEDGTMPGPNSLAHPITWSTGPPTGRESRRAWLTPSTYRYTPRAEGEPRLDPAKVLGVIAAYAYQSCEHPQWHESAAAAYLSRLGEAIQRRGLTNASGWHVDTIAEAQ